jgi:hypothetical protein
VVGGAAGFVFYMIATWIPINAKSALGRPEADPEVDPAPEFTTASP